MDVIGLFAYMISPSMVLADVAVSACDFNEYCRGLEGAVLAYESGVTRSMDLCVYELLGFVLGGSGLVDGVYGSE
jgi:hypothetical protein